MNSPDLRMEIVIGRVLRIGVAVAAMLVFAGGIPRIARVHNGAPNYRQFHATPDSPMHLALVIAKARALDSRSIVQLGILLLIATPVVRVIVCVAGFAAQRDGLYILVSITVLAVLFYSLFFRT